MNTKTMACNVIQGLSILELAVLTNYLNGFADHKAVPTRNALDRLLDSHGSNCSKCKKKWEEQIDFGADSYHKLEKVTGNIDKWRKIVAKAKDLAPELNWD